MNDYNVGDLLVLKVKQFTIEAVQEHRFNGLILKRNDSILLIHEYKHEIYKNTYFEIFKPDTGKCYIVKMPQESDIFCRID